MHLTSPSLLFIKCKSSCVFLFVLLLLFFVCLFVVLFGGVGFGGGGGVGFGFFPLFRKQAVQTRDCLLLRCTRQCRAWFTPAPSPSSTHGYQRSHDNTRAREAAPSPQEAEQTLRQQSPLPAPVLGWHDPAGIISAQFQSRICLLSRHAPGIPAVGA